MAYRVAKQGYEPKDPAIRKKLGLPEVSLIRQYRAPDGTFTKKPPAN